MLFGFRLDFELVPTGGGFPPACHCPANLRGAHSPFRAALISQTAT
jgi:hypothetical protein